MDIEVRDKIKENYMLQICDIASVRIGKILLFT